MNTINRTYALLAGVSLLISACSLPFAGRGGDDMPRPDIAVDEAPSDDVTRPLARAGGGDDALPTQAPEPASDGFLGETLAGLGAPGEAGVWLSTGLVTEPRQGRVESESGSSLRLELRPSGGLPSAGSQISLSAMQSLGLSLGSLATLRVYVE
ncbi:D-galactarate dehydratase [Pararhodobacter oceanensis]|uniref:D-galactarate dehydratase n=1 Tax=Pararhodobacter oceanensis TaxID=2172121 RepID=UPI003A8E1CB4